MPLLALASGTSAASAYCSQSILGLIARSLRRLGSRGRIRRRGGPVRLPGGCGVPGSSGGRDRQTNPDPVAGGRAGGSAGVGRERPDVPDLRAGIDRRRSWSDHRAPGGDGRCRHGSAGATRARPGQRHERLARRRPTRPRRERGSGRCVRSEGGPWLRRRGRGGDACRALCGPTRLAAQASTGLPAIAVVSGPGPAPPSAATTRVACPGPAVCQLQRTPGHRGLLLEGPAFGLGPFCAGLFGVLGLAGVFVAPLAGILSDRHGPDGVTRAGIAAVATAFPLMAFVPGLAGFVSGVMALDAGLQLAVISQQSIIFGLTMRCELVSTQSASRHCSRVAP